MSKILGAAAIVAFAFSLGLPSYHSSCSLDRAKAESVVRAQREQTWRYAFARSPSVIADVVYQLIDTLLASSALGSNVPALGNALTACDTGLAGTAALADWAVSPLCHRQPSGHGCRDASAGAPSSRFGQGPRRE